MKKKILIMFVLFIVPAFVYAGEKEKLAEELIKLTDMQQSLERLIEQDMQIQLQAIKQISSSEENERAMSEFFKKISAKTFELGTDTLLLKIAELSDFIVLKNGHSKSAKPVGNAGI
ncbi:MAG: hypothetical protein GY795_32090 [Desulfobacterales bacterium]|nr:hypothetical protein [Desulfobacterales bacterium]